MGDDEGGGAPPRLRRGETNGSAGAGESETRWAQPLGGVGVRD